MMNSIPGKQYIIDLGIILGFPGLLLGLYFYMGGNISSSFSFLSVGGLSLPGNDTGQLGEKAKMTLEALRSTTLDTAIFDDPAYQSLRDYSVEIPTTVLGREYPFSLPDEVQEMLNKSRGGSGTLPPLPPPPPQTPAAKK
jgi:hypothetical protein